MVEWYPFCPGFDFILNHVQKLYLGPPTVEKFFEPNSKQPWDPLYCIDYTPPKFRFLTRKFQKISITKGRKIFFSSQIRNNLNTFYAPPKGPYLNAQPREFDFGAAVTLVLTQTRQLFEWKFTAVKDYITETYMDDHLSQNRRFLWLRETSTFGIQIFKMRLWIQN